MSDFTQEELQIIRKSARVLCRREGSARVDHVADTVELKIGIRYGDHDIEAALHGEGYLCVGGEVWLADHASSATRPQPTAATPIDQPVAAAAARPNAPACEVAPHKVQQLPEVNVREDSKSHANVAERSIQILCPPSLLCSTIRALNLDTIDDLLHLDWPTVRKLPGVGAKKLRLLRQLQDTARARFHVRPDVNPKAEPGWLDHPWEDVLVWLPTRAWKVFEAAGYASVREVETALVRGELSALANLGHGSIYEVREQLRRLRTDGETAYRFGVAGAPRSVQAMVDHFLDGQPERTREIIRGWYLREQALDEIAGAWGIDRQRAQQIATITERERRPYTSIAHELLDQEIGDITRRPGAFTVVTADVARQTRLALALAGVDCAVFDGVICSTASRPEVDAVLERIQNALRGPGGGPNRDTLTALEAQGLTLRESELEILVAQVGSLQVDTPTFQPHSTPGTVLTEILAGFGASVGLEAIMAWYDMFRADGTQVPELTPDLAQRWLAGEPLVWNCGPAEYVHESALPCATAALDTLAQWVMAALDGYPDGVDAEFVLQLAVQDGAAPDGATAYLLRDAVSRHPKGLTLGDALTLWHADSPAARKRHMAQLLDAVLRSFDRPASTESIRRELILRGHMITSLPFALSRASDIVEVSPGHYQHQSKIVVVEPRSTDDSSDDSADLAAQVLEALRQLGCGFASDVSARVSAAGSVRAALFRAEESGALGRLPGGLFFVADPVEENLWAAWDRQRSSVLRCAVHPSMKTHDPTVVWSMARYVEQVVGNEEIALDLMTDLGHRADCSPELQDKVARRVRTLTAPGLSRSQEAESRTVEPTQDMEPSDPIEANEPPVVSPRTEPAVAKPAGDEAPDAEAQAAEQWFARQLGEELRERYLVSARRARQVGIDREMSDSDVGSALRAMEARGELLRLPGNYYSIADTREALFRRWAKRHSMLTVLVRESADDCSPDVWLLLALYFDRCGEEDLAVTRLVRQMKTSDGVSRAIRGEADELGFARTMRA